MHLLTNSLLFLAVLAAGFCLPASTLLLFVR